MVRKGDYTVYQNEEYRFVREKDNSISLISNSKKDLKRNFEEYADGVYVKNVKSKDIGNAYQIKTYGTYQNRNVNIRIIKDGNVLIGTPDASLARELGLDRSDKYYYEKWVPKNEVTIFEDRKEIKL